MVVKKKKEKATRTRISRDLDNVVALRLSDELLEKLQTMATDAGCPTSILIRMILMKAVGEK
jgi:predicted DNA binding CopG/RHH family protein